MDRKLYRYPHGGGNGGGNIDQPLVREQEAYPADPSHYMGMSSNSEQSNQPAGPFRIQSARGTPKGPLPIDVQISLLTSVLQHDPFNCAIRKTTQAWESISREQGIRARTCSRRFDNIIQASIAGRDRPIGTEEQQATKKRLLEQLFEMMNQPQALKRRYRSEDTDRQLLLETIRLNPFAQKVGQVAKAWEDVRDALKMKVHARQCIRRVNRMVKPYQLRERMYKGNIPEEMREANDDLVKQIITLMRQAGQGGSLDDGCNSNDEDSASFMSDSEDQEEYMDGQRENAQEEDEDDEDEDMMSRSESEQRSSGQKKQDDNSAPRSPIKRHSSHSSNDRVRNNGSADVNMVEAAQQQQQDSSTPRHRPSWEGEPADSKMARPVNNGADQSPPLSSPLPVHSPGAPHPPISHIPGHARHYSQGEFAGGAGDYKRPMKHARTSSRGGYEIPLERGSGSNSNRFAPFPPSAYQPGNSGRGGPALDSHGRPIIPSGPPETPIDHPHAMRGGELAVAGAESQSGSSPSVQQFREILNEMQIMREYLGQMDEQRRADMDKQSNMLHLIDKMQHQLSQQQHQLSQLQHQLRSIRLITGPSRRLQVTLKLLEVHHHQLIRAVAGIRILTSSSILHTTITTSSNDSGNDIDDDATLASLTAVIAATQPPTPPKDLLSLYAFCAANKPPTDGLPDIGTGFSLPLILDDLTQMWPPDQHDNVIVVKEQRGASVWTVNLFPMVQHVLMAVHSEFFRAYDQWVQARQAAVASITIGGAPPAAGLSGSEAVGGAIDFTATTAAKTAFLNMPVPSPIGCYKEWLRGSLSNQISLT
ncbi:hypothetical protein BGZ89_006163, partial [Linnemannia elongata]